MKRLLILLILTCINLFVYAQKVTIIESPSVKAMMAKFVDKNLGSPTMKGWRIQIISTDDRRQMEQARSKFASLHPRVSSSWKHVSPYYQLRVGAYREKNDLMPFLAEIKRISRQLRQLWTISISLI